MARRENAREAADTAEKPRSLGPARAAARREGPQTAADRTVGPNLTLFLCYINDLLAEGEGFEPSIRFPVYTLSKRAPSAVRTIPDLWRAIADALEAYTPIECTNYFAAAGYDRDYIESAPAAKVVSCLAQWWYFLGFGLE